MIEVKLDASIAAGFERREESIWHLFTKRCILAAIALILAQWVLVPGFIGIDVPSHSDLWRYYAVAHEQPFRDAILGPRPLMVLFLHMLRAIDDARVFFCILNIPALMFVSAGLIAGELVAGKRVGHMVAFLSFVALFATPTFYELNPLDYGGMLAGTLVACLVGWLAAERARIDEGKASPLLKVMMVVGLLSYLSIETKPTFAALLPFVPLLLVRRFSTRKLLLLCSASVVFILLSVVKDVLLKSPFIQVGGGDSPYKVASNPIAILGAGMYYVSRIVPLTMLPVAGILLYSTWKSNRWIALGAVGASFLAVLPMCAIPTRLLSMYSWFGLAVLAPVLVPYTNWATSRATMRVVLVGFCLLGLIGVARGKHLDKAETRWIVANHQFNKNVFKGLQALQSRILPGERLLVGGAMAPYNPFKNDRFVALTTPVPFTWSVAYPASEKPLVDMSPDSHVHVQLNDVDLSKFDRVAIFDGKGLLTTMAPAAAYASLGKEQLAATFYCSADLAEFNSEVRTMKVVICLNRFGEHLAAARYAETNGDSSNNQWLWFERGKANEALGHVDEARMDYTKAVSLEKAPVFEEALKRVNSTDHR